MTAHRIAGYGSWSSPITSDFVVAEVIGLADLRIVGGAIYWIEARPMENGRNVLIRRRTDGTIGDVTPAPYNVRTRVHEYGGAAYVIAGDTVFFSNFADQRLYRLDPGGAARPFSTRSGTRYADGRFDAPHSRLVLVREDHGGPSAEPTNTIGLRCKWPSRANAPCCAAQTSSPKHRVPDCRRSSALNAQTSQSELSLADAMHQLDAGDRDRRIPEPLEAEHHRDALLHAPMVLLNQVVQVLRRAQVRVRGQRAIGFQLAHRTVRCSVAVQRDCLRGALLASDRFAKERLGGRDIALGAQPEVDRPARPIDGTVEVDPLASDLDVCLVDSP